MTQRRKPRTAGAAFERSIATDLRGWLGDGWVVLRNQTDRQRGQGATMPGEFTVQRAFPDADGPPSWPFAIECKTSLDFSALTLWRPEPTKQIEGWWEQARRQAGGDLCPLLIATGRCREAPTEPVLAIMPAWTFARLWRVQETPQYMRLTIGADVVRACLWSELVARPVSVLGELVEEAA